MGLCASLSGIAVHASPRLNACSWCVPPLQARATKYANYSVGYARPAPWQQCCAAAAWVRQRAAASYRALHDLQSDQRRRRRQGPAPSGGRQVAGDRDGDSSRGSDGEPKQLSATAGSASWSPIDSARRAAVTTTAAAAAAAAPPPPPQQQQQQELPVCSTAASKAPAIGAGTPSPASSCATHAGSVQYGWPRGQVRLVGMQCLNAAATASPARVLAPTHPGGSIQCVASTGCAARASLRCSSRQRHGAVWPAASTVPAPTLARPAGAATHP